MIDMNLALVIITKDRPQMVDRLIWSILQAKLHSYSIVLIDDSSPANFSQIMKSLRSHSVRSIQLSSIQARNYVEKDLDEANLTQGERKFIEDCTGLRSPFDDFVGCLYGRKAESRSTRVGLRFAPYSPARNLGIYCAVKFFNPDVIFFLDDDCLILQPGKLREQLQLIQQKLKQRSIVAIAGNYKDLPGSEPKTASGKGVLEKSVGILRGMDAFLKQSLSVETARYKINPPHMLGGALILSKRVFCNLPFDPYVARGEDHAYAWDLRAFLSEKEIAIRDNHFLIGHRREETFPEREETNILRDVFRFVYMRAKIGRSFISLFTVRWALASLIRCLFNPSKCAQCKRELWALMLFAPRFARENAIGFRRNLNAWINLLNQPK